MEDSPDLAGGEAVADPALAVLPRLLSIDEVCVVLGVHRNTLRRWRLRDVGPTSYAVGGGWVYRQDEVMEWVRRSCSCCHRVHGVSDTSVRSR